MTQISRFTEQCVLIAERVTGDRDESDLVSLHCLRIYLDTSYHMTIHLLKEIPQIIRKIGLDAADLPAPSTLCKALDRIEISFCRVLLRQSVQLHDLSEHAALDATFYECDRASRHYCHRTNYRVQTLKATKLVDTESQAVLDVYCSTTLKGSDVDLYEQIARRNAAICGHSLQTRATTRTLSASGSVSSKFARSSSIACAHRTITRTTSKSTRISTHSDQ